DGVGRVVQALEVLGEAEDPSAVDPNAFEHTVAVEETMVVDRDGGGLAIVPLAIEPDGRGTGSLSRWLSGRSGSSHEVNLSSRTAPPQLAGGVSGDPRAPYIDLHAPMSRWIHAARAAGGARDPGRRGGAGRAGSPPGTDRRPGE